MNIDESEAKAASRAEAAALFERLFKSGIQPHAQAITEILSRGEIAVVVFELHPSHRKAARAIGWKGKPVFPIPRATAYRMAMATGDEVTRRWVKREQGPGRIFVMMHLGTLLLNLDPETGFSLEPGSTYTERERLTARRPRRSARRGRS